MKRHRTLSVLAATTLATTLLVAALATDALAGGGPQNVLVVANRRSETSRTIARYYMEKRRIPPANLLEVDASPERSVPFETFRREIARPLRLKLCDETLRGRIDYLVLTDGLPIRVRLPGGWVSSCALLQVLDTAVFGRDQIRLPVIRNPYRDAGKAFSHAASFGGHHLYLVTFLIGYTAADAKRLVDLSVASDGKPAKGDFIFQDARGNASGRNRSYPAAIGRLTERDFKAEQKPHGPDEVKERDGIMGYMSGGSYSGLKRDRVQGLTFRPGALVDMLESFGAVPKNFDPKQKSQFPVTWFVEAGVTGVHGAVAEPYAHTFPDVLLFERYTKGFNLAESFYQSLPFLYWMNMVIGDPLAQPFAVAPRVMVEGVGASVSGEATVKIRAEPPEGESVRGIEIFFRGRPVGRIEGASGEAAWDTRAFRNGPGTLHAFAVLAGDRAVQGHAFHETRVRNETLAVTRTTPKDGEPDARRSGPIRVAFNRPLAPASAGADGLSVTDADGGRVPGRWIVEEDRHVLSFLPGDPLRAATPFLVRVPASVRDGEGKPFGSGPLDVSFTTTAASLEVSAPETVRAGEAFEVRVRAVGGDGARWAGFRGRVRLSGDDAQGAFPAGRRFTTDEKGEAVFTVTLGTAGERTLTAEDLPAGVAGTATMTVRHGSFEGVEIDLPRRCALGQETVAVFRAVDRFGNTVKDYTGDLSVASPASAKAVHPETIPFKEADQGRVEAHGIFFGAAGSARLVALEGEKRLGQGDTKVVEDGIRSWLALGPFSSPGKKASGIPLPVDPASARPHPGRVETGGVWEPKRSGSGNQTVRGVPREGVMLYHAWVLCPSGGAELKAGSSDALAVYVNGKKAYAREKTRKFKAGQDRIRNAGLQEGWNRVLVRAARTAGGAPAFSVRVVLASGKNPPGYRTQTDDPEGNARLDVSGRVLAGGRGLGGVTVSLSGETGRQTSTTASDGRFAFRDVDGGRYRIEATGKGLAFTPATREVEAGPGNVFGLRFEVVDHAPPTVTSLSLRDRQRVAGRLPVEAEAADNLGVKEIRFLLDGKPFGKPVSGGSGSSTLDFTMATAGSHDFAARAVDGAGNVSEPRAVSIWVVQDTRGPKIRLVKPRSARWSRGKVALEAQASDRYGVARVTFFFDGKAVGKPLTSEPWKATLDASKAKTGYHELKIEAEDRSGNVTARTYRVAVK